MDQYNSLEKFTIYLKNIIFFKSIIYLVVIISLVLILRVYDRELISSQNLLSNITVSLNTTEEKLKYLSDVQNQVTELNDLDNQIALISDTDICNKRIKFIHNINELAKKYNTTEQFKFKIRQQGSQNTGITNSDIILRNYELEILFAASDFNTTFNIINDIMNLMPVYSKAVSLDIVNQDVITPNNIINLNQNALIELINTKLVIYINEIVKK